MDFDITKVLIGAVVAIIGYFLRDTMTELKSVRQQSEANRAGLELLRMEYTGKFDHLTEKVSELKETLNDLIAEIKKLNSNMYQNR